MTDVSPPASADPLTALADLTAAAARGDDLDSALAAILERGAAALGASGAMLAVQDPDRAGLEVAAALGTHREGDSPWVVDGSSPLAQAVTTRTPSWGRPSENGQAIHADLPLVARRDGIDSVLGGVTFSWSPPHDLSATERSVASAVADLAALVVDRARLASLIAERAEWFERMAQSDPLTGLANQRTFARVLELELARAGRQGGEVSVALVDVDDFVATNTENGHEAGDDVLRAVAAVLNDSVRLVDTVARIGGDEFVVIAPGSAGMTVARRVLAGVAALPGVGGRPISVSAGIARFPVDGTTADELLEAAAEALASAKAQGRSALQESGSQATG